MGALLVQRVPDQAYRDQAAQAEREGQSGAHDRATRWVNPSEYDDQAFRDAERNIAELNSRLQILIVNKASAIRESFIARYVSKMFENVRLYFNRKSNLSDETNKKAAVDFLMRSIGDEFNIAGHRVEHAVRAMLGDIAPISAPALWKERKVANKGEDANLDPIGFLRKHWGDYIDRALVCQVDLRSMDKPLFDAVRNHLNYKGTSAVSVLPQPYKSRLGR